MSDLTAEQKAAVESKAEWTSIVAPPGSGKTHTLVARVEHLIERAQDPRKMVIVTFTRKAAAELNERLPRRPWAHLGTLHGLAMKSRKDQKLAIASEKEMIEACATVAKAHDKPIIEVARASRDPQGTLTKMLERSVVEHLEDKGLISMDRVLTEFAEQEHDFECMLVDEVQDASAVDWKIYSQARNLTVVGDPNQAIYYFRGGSAENWRRAYKRNREKTTVYALTTNFRSGHKVVEGANAMMGTSMVALREAPQGFFGVKRVDTDKEEWDLISGSIKRREPDKTTMVLCRTNAQADDARVQLGARGVKIATLAKEPSKLAIALAYCHERPHSHQAAKMLALAKKQKLTSQLPTVEEIMEGLGEQWPVTRETVARAAPKPYQDQLMNPDLSTIEVIEEEAVEQAGVQVMTIHKAKGKQCDYVFVPGATDRRFSDRDDEDGRVLFVAITRARRGCAITSAKREGNKPTTAQRWAKSEE